MKTSEHFKLYSIISVIIAVLGAVLLMLMPQVTILAHISFIGVMALIGFGIAYLIAVQVEYNTDDDIIMDDPFDECRDMIDYSYHPDRD